MSAGDMRQFLLLSTLPLTLFFSLRVGDLEQYWCTFKNTLLEGGGDSGWGEFSGVLGFLFFFFLIFLLSYLIYFFFPGLDSHRATHDVLKATPWQVTRRRMICYSIIVFKLWKAKSFVELLFLIQCDYLTLLEILLIHSPKKKNPSLIVLLKTYTVS